jgi:NadR type nicotinamide-nucleotide adenylyltransferase
MLKRIAILGPESTGKSTLAEDLASHFGEPWVPEFARDFLSGRGPKYQYEDLKVIALGQIAREDELAKKAKRFLLCDTDLTVIKIWSKHVFGMLDQYIDAELAKRHYDLYLLCDIDLVWVADPLREHPHLRSYFFEVYLNECRQRRLPFHVISGTREHRVNRAIQLLESHFPQT